jgi:hypothetical protein
MVNIKIFKDQLIEMSNFYISLPDKVESEADLYFAAIGKKSAIKLLQLLSKNGSTLKRHHLSQLSALLMSLTRGVEQFEKEEIQVKHQYYGQLIYSLSEYISNPES